MTEYQSVIYWNLSYYSNAASSSECIVYSENLVSLKKIIYVLSVVRKKGDKARLCIKSVMMMRTV